MGGAGHRLSQQLTDLLESLDGQDITVGELVDRIGDRGYGIFFLLLSLPAALPLPAPGYASPFGVMMIGLGTQMARGREVPWFPERTRKRTLNYKLLRFSIRNGRLPLRVVEFLVRPRLSTLARSKGMRRAVALVIMAMAVSMSIPLPLTNTAPAFTIFVLAAGILEEDGLLLLGGLLLAPVAAGIAGLALWAAATVGPEAAEETVKAWLGRGG
jgi:hypothetical protein